MTMAFYKIASIGFIGATILILSEIPTVKICLREAIARRRATNRKGGRDAGISRGAPAESPIQGEPENRDLEEAVALAIEVERERHEPYPREWE
jgi:hypothetical protein